MLVGRDRSTVITSIIQCWHRWQMRRLELKKRKALFKMLRDLERASVAMLNWPPSESLKVVTKWKHDSLKLQDEWLRNKLYQFVMNYEKILRLKHSIQQNENQVD